MKRLPIYILYAILGCVLASAGVTPNNPFFWILMLIIVSIDIVSSLQSR